MENSSIYWKFRSRDIKVIITPSANTSIVNAKIHLVTKKFPFFEYKTERKLLLKRICSCLKEQMVKEIHIRIGTDAFTSRFHLWANIQPLSLKFSTICDFYSYESICLRLYIFKLVETFRSKLFHQLKTNATFLTNVWSLPPPYANEISNEISICGSLQLKKKVAIFVKGCWRYFTCSG